MTSTNNHTHILIIGNGFDLNLGLKTSYSDFIKSGEFYALLSNGNSLCHYLMQQHELQNWIDIENELKTYSVTGNLKTFEEDYYSLCTGLMKYLNNIDYSLLNRTSSAYLLLQDLLNEEFLILDFNYTNTISFILETFGLTKEKIKSRLVKMHGAVDAGQIIFGVEDGAQIKKEHIFLKKSYNIAFQAIKFDELVEGVYELIFFGHSLGETDHMYFSDFFIGSASGSYSPKKLNFYYYHQKGYKELHIQLDSLTLHRLTKFKQNNKFIPYDASTNVTFKSSNSAL